MTIRTRIRKIFTRKYDPRKYDPKKDTGTIFKTLSESSGGSGYVSTTDPSVPGAYQGTAAQQQAGKTNVPTGSSSYSSGGGASVGGGGRRCFSRRWWEGGASVGWCFSHINPTRSNQFRSCWRRYPSILFRRNNKCLCSTNYKRYPKLC